MELGQIEYAAQIIFTMCREHPELCPHDYEWEWSQTKENIKEEHYKCRLCGNEIVKERKI